MILIWFNRADWNYKSSSKIKLVAKEYFLEKFTF